MKYLQTYKILYLVNVSDEEYKNLINIFDENNLDKQLTKHFI